MNTGIKKYKNLTRGAMLAFLSWTICFNCFSQGTEIDIAGKRPAWLELSVGPALNQYILHISPPDQAALTRKHSTLFYGLDAGYYFTNHFGASLGLGVTTAAPCMTMTSFTDQYDAKDSEMESYERRIIGNGISEEQKISFLNIPLQLNLKGSLGRSVGFYIQSGFSISLLLKKSYNSTGTFTYTGFYPEYNVLIKDVAYEGFQSNVKNDVTGTLELKSVNPQFIASSGLQFLLQRKLQFSIGINYNKMLVNPSDYDSVNTFHLSDYPDKMQSMTEGADDISFRSFGLKLAFRYYL